MLWLKSNFLGDLKERPSLLINWPREVFYVLILLRQTNENNIPNSQIYITVALQ